MFEHFIIMASLYHKGTRIALPYVYSGGVDKNEIQDVLDSMEQVGKGYANEGMQMKLCKWSYANEAMQMERCKWSYANEAMQMELCK